MARCRVVHPDVIRLPVSDGDWIDVKRELTAGEYHAFLLDLSDRKPFAKILAYVLAWSFVGLEGQPLPYAGLSEDDRRDIVRSLDKATVRELIATLDRHEVAQDAALEEKKRMTATSSMSSPSSPSVGP